MDRDHVKAALISVLQEVQVLSNLSCPPITGATKPVDELPEFDSKIWPVALGMVGAKLGIDVPSDVNVFWRRKDRCANTIEETVTAILAFTPLTQKPPVAEAAA